MTSNLRVSPSIAAHTKGGIEISSKLLFHPIYTHHFAIELHNHFLQMGDTDGTVGLAECVSTLIQLAVPQNALLMETSRTTVLTRALDRYIFPDDKFSEAACFHQICSRIMERPDVYICPI